MAVYMISLSLSVARNLKAIKVVWCEGTCTVCTFVHTFVYSISRHIL